MRGRVLIVEDDRELGALLELGLRAAGFRIEWRDAAEPALQAMREEPFDVVVTDVHLRDSNGLDLCSILTREWPSLPVLIITGFGSMEAAISAIRAGAHDFLLKPFDLDALAEALDRAVGRRRFEARRLRPAFEAGDGFGLLVGASPRMRRLYEQLERVAASEAAVLITGESGTGKELIARSLHDRGRRAAGPFVAINCAAMPEQLLESELFGHARGAFTDAKAERAGLFAQAHGGTLFLDEVGDLSPGLQPKLLRALQERRVRPVGGSAEVPFDARILAATNRDLERDVEAGRFRQDLYFRLNVIRVEAPPLRDRGEDVLSLARYFLDRIAAREEKAVHGIEAAAADRLLQHSWPGNVRELENCIERAVAMTDHDLVRLEDLPEMLRRPARGSESVAASSDGTLTIDELERRHIMAVLSEAGGNKSLAARLLGVDRRTLYRKLEAFGLGR